VTTLPLFGGPALLDVKPTKLRPYQDRAIHTIRARVREGKKRILLVAPTGAGKAVLMASIIRTSSVPVMVVVHRLELVDQQVAQLAKLGISNVGVMRGNDERTNPSASVQVASIQTLARRDKPPAGLILVDEAHKAAADSYGTSVFDAYPDAIIIGFTATPTRQDGRPLGAIFDCMEIAATYAELIRGKFIAEPVCYRAPEQPDLSNVRIVGGDYDEGQLGEVMRDKRLVGRLLDHWLALANKYPNPKGGIGLVEGPRRRTFIFATGIQHSLDICAKFSAAGVKIAHVDGETPEDERRRIVKALGTGELEAISNCNILLEGADVPSAKCVVHARPTQSLVLWRQCLDEKTEILTKRGFCGPDEIHMSDEVAAFDLKTGNASWQQITRVIDRPIQHEEAMYSIQSRHMDLRVTNGHRMVYKRRSVANGLPVWPDEWSIDIASSVSSIKSAYKIPSAGVELAPGVNLSDDEIRFLGWFLTDGWISKKNNAISICQSIEQPHILEIDRCLNGCGFKYRKTIREPKDRFPNGKPLAVYTISKGIPRGTGKHLRGWGGKLDPFIDKNLSYAYEEMNRHQLGVLLSAIHLGDGNKYDGDGTWKSHSYHITSGRKLFVDRLQSLCVRRGWRCNVASGVSQLSGNPIYRMHIKNSSERSVSARGQGRARLELCDHTPGERIWCVDNPVGTIFVRRNGKVAIVGNSTGRILRPWHSGCPDGCLAHPSVEPILLDHASNIAVHGYPHEDLHWSLSTRAKRVETKLKMKICKQCYAYIAPSRALCPYCGYEFKPGDEPPKTVAETEEQLVRYKMTPEDMRRQFFDGMVQLARKRGNKTGFASVKYKEHYGTWPPWAWSNEVKASFESDAEWQANMAARLARKKAEEEPQPELDVGLDDAIEYPEEAPEDETEFGAWLREQGIG